MLVIAPGCHTHSPRALSAAQGQGYQATAPTIPVQPPGHHKLLVRNLVNVAAGRGHVGVPELGLDDVDWHSLTPEPGPPAGR
mgnify:CR=1 FL=1